MTRAGRITVDSAVMGGPPSVRRLRVSVGTVLPITALAQAADTLEDGALVTVSPRESRVRILPLPRS